METTFSNLSGLQIFYLVSAILGGILFIARTVILVIGLDHDVDSHMELDHGNLEHTDSDQSFKILTINGLTSFFVIFGLTGLALHRPGAFGTLLSLAGATAAGLFTVWILGKLLASAKNLQSSGNIDPVGTIGTEGTVYSTIPANGTGSVQIIVKDRLREFNAVSRTKERIDTGEHIKVVWVEGNTLEVEKG